MSATRIIYTEEQLKALGLVENPFMWIADGWFFCVTCQRYTYHFAMSHPRQADCFEVCKECKTYSGPYSPQ